MENYIAEFRIERYYNPEKSKTLRTVRYLVDEVIPDDDYGDNLSQFAVKYLLKKRDFTKDTDCICVSAKYWNEDDDPDDPLTDPIAELHAYVYRDV